MASVKTVVRWQFNKSFLVRRTFPSMAQALVYAKRIERLWGIWPIMKVVKN